MYYIDSISCIQMTTLITPRRHPEDLHRRVKNGANLGFSGSQRVSSWDCFQNKEMRERVDSKSRVYLTLFRNNYFQKNDSFQKIREKPPLFHEYRTVSKVWVDSLSWLAKESTR
jgi:hypothetical protein